jgi:hypothetical protein
MHIKKRIRKLKEFIRDFIVRLTGHRYYELLSPDHAPINFRVDIFGKAQYLKTDYAIQHVYNRPTPLIWMNCIERNNKKSPWVKEHKDI